MPKPWIRHQARQRKTKWRLLTIPTKYSSGRYPLAVAGRWPLTISKSREEAQRRWEMLTAAGSPWIRVGTALCGQAAGADQVVETFISELDSQGLNAQVSRVGCLGLCFAEPMVDVLVPGRGRVVYGNVGPEDVKRIVSDHLGPGRARIRSGHGPYREGKRRRSTVSGPAPYEGQGATYRPSQRGAHRPAGHLPIRGQRGLRGVEPGPHGNDGGRGIGRSEHFRPPGPGRSCLSRRVPSGDFLPGPTPPTNTFSATAKRETPGAFNDKGILESDPHTVVEGIILAGYATGANHGYIFIRHGHDGPIERAQTAVNQAYELGLLGKEILGTDFRL